MPRITSPSTSLPNCASAPNAAATTIVPRLEISPSRSS
jgi:hypothetical protein